MKFAIVPDLHLVAPPERLWGLDPFARLDACLTDLESWHGDAQFCVIMGDIADRGELEAYRALEKRLKTFPIETVLLVGNHDDRSVLQRVFPDAPHDDHGFVQGERRTPEGLFLFLDTLKAGTSAGEYCQQRRDWLSERLDAARDTPVYLFMHHPPFDINIPYMDRIKLEEADAFADIALRHGNVRHLFFAHVHRPVQAVWRGITCTSLPAINHQVPLRRESVTSRYSDEPPMYAVVDIEPDRLVVNCDCFLHRKDCAMPPNKR
jgi:3',5'-cyclic AMP phosphodiesterase CpdA